VNILITGGTGFLGSCLARRLAGNHEVSVLGRGIKQGYLTKEEMKAFNFIQCDVRDKKSMAEALKPDHDLIIHCAAVVRIGDDGESREDLVETNVNSTLTILELMAEKGIKNLIFSSSMTVYGMENRIPVSENGVLDPVHFYGVSKKTAEETIINYAQKNLTRALVLRYPGLYGYPRRSGYVFSVAKKLLMGEDVTIDTKGLKFWETINVEDAAEITEKLIGTWEWNKNCETINCSYAEETDFVATAFKIKEIVDSKSRINVTQPLDYVRFYLDNSRLRGLVGFERHFEKSLKHFLEEHRDWILQ